MILAAGNGTRLRPLTDHMPKALVEVGGRPLIDIQMERLQKAGFRDITVNVHHFADMLEDHIMSHRPAGADIHISSERERLLNTGGAIKKAGKALLERDSVSPLLVHNTDILSNADLMSLYRASIGHDAFLLVSKRDSSRGLFFDSEMHLRGWKNFKTGEVKSPLPDFDERNYERYAFSGIHVIAPAAIRTMEKWPDEFSVIDFYLQEAASLDIRGYAAPYELRLLDVGKPAALESAAAFLHSVE